jgi:mRNA interferase RelE/StbE
MFAIEIKRNALNNLTKLDRKRRETIKEVVSILKLYPIPFKKADVSKIKGYNNVYRIRAGDARLVYEVHRQRRAKNIHCIGSREKAYRKTI